MPNAILIIDDEATLAKNIKTHLTRHGYEAQIAASGEKGLAQLDGFRPDVVLLAETTLIEPQHLALCPALVPVPSAGAADDFSPGQPFPETGINLERMEQDLLVQALQHTGWNVSRAAKLLGLSRDTLRYRMEKYRLYAPA